MRLFSFQSSVGFDERNKSRSDGTLEKGGAVWRMAATNLHIENVTSERSIALVLTMIRWWEAL